MELTLPFDNATEDAVLGAMIRYPEEIDEVMPYIVSEDIFGQERARALWKIIKKMRSQNKKIEPQSIVSLLKKEDMQRGIDAYYVSTCYGDSPAKGGTAFYARILYEKYVLREIIIKTQQIQVKASNEDGEIYSIINEAHTLFGQVLEFQPTQTVSINEIIEETLDGINNKTNKLIKTGYPQIDKFAGGLTRGEITIVGGRPGHGKTTVLINLLARMLSTGHKAIFFSRELPNSELIKKIICLESGELSYSMVRKNIYNESELSMVNQSISIIKEKYNEGKFLMFDNIRSFEASSSEVKRFKPDIILDDYIQLIAYTGREDQRRLQLEKLCNEYKWLAKEVNAVVILASQLNRGIEHRDKSYVPQLSDLAESGAIEQVAENVFFTHYDYKVKGEAGKGKNVLTISAKKIRYGDTGYVDLGYDGDKCKIYNSIEEMVHNDEIPF